MNFVRSLTVYKIFENSLPIIIKKNEVTPLGRWVSGNHGLKTFYANTDHCGDNICGNPKILKKSYPKYFKL